MNTGLTPTGLPAYLAYASCHSVSNHPPMVTWLFVRSLFLSAHVHCLAYLSRLAGNPPPRRLGLQNGLRTALAGSSHRLAESSLRCSFIHELCYGLAVHLRQLSTPCRHDAVAFGHRPVILDLTGTFTPLCKRPRRRTSAGVLACATVAVSRFTLVTPTASNSFAFGPIPGN